MPTTFPNIFNEEVLFEAYDKTHLQYNTIDTGTEIVKAIRQIIPDDETAILNAQTYANLSANLIVPKTVVVANSATLTTLYVENEDYIIDYSNGKIRRTSSTDISDGQTIYIWYLPYVKLTLNSDYNFDYTEGSINRRAGSSIQDGATIYIDYSHSQVDVSDNLIDEVILQTDAMFDKIIKTEFINSTEKAIESAATNYCMYLISLSQAQKTLRLSRTVSDDLGKVWIELSKSYFATANTFLSSYLAFGSLSSGDKKLNANSTFAGCNIPRVAQRR